MINYIGRQYDEHTEEGDGHNVARLGAEQIHHEV